MRLPESVTKIQPVGAVLKASEAGEALLREAGAVSYTHLFSHRKEHSAGAVHFS